MQTLCKGPVHNPPKKKLILLCRSPLHPADMKLALLLFFTSLLGCGAQVDVAAAGGDPPPTKNGDTAVTVSPWPMLGQGPAHAARSLSAVTTAGPHRSWELSLGEALRGSCVIAADGTIYAATQHALHAISPAGTEKWTAPIQLPGEEPPSPALGPDGAVYVKSGKALVAFDPGGAPLWHVDFPEGVLSSPTVTADGTIYVARGDGGLAVLSPTGSVQTTVGAEPNVRHSTPAIAADGTMTFMRVDTYLTEVWAFGPAGAPGFDVKKVGSVYGYQAYPVSGADGTTYVATDEALAALDSMGDVVWSHPSSSNNMGPAVAADGTLYPSWGYPLTALHPDGTVAWSYDGGPGAYGASVAIAADGTIYSGGDRLYRVSPAGALLGVVDVGSPIASRLAIDADGTALFGAEDGKLYAR